VLAYIPDQQQHWYIAAFFQSRTFQHLSGGGSGSLENMLKESFMLLLSGVSATKSTLQVSGANRFSCFVIMCELFYAHRKRAKGGSLA